MPTTLWYRLDENSVTVGGLHGDQWADVRDLFDKFNFFVGEDSCSKHEGCSEVYADYVPEESRHHVATLAVEMVKNGWTVKSEAMVSLIESARENVSADEVTRLAREDYKSRWGRYPEDD